MTRDLMFNLTALAEDLVKKNRKLALAGKIRGAVDTNSIHTDLMLALDACEALTFSINNLVNQPQQFREASEAALLSYILIMYARALKSNSKIRKQYDPRRSFTPDELVVHNELCGLRDDGVAHFGKGGSYVGDWAIELAVIDIADGSGKIAVTTRRLVVDRALLSRARDQIKRALEIIKPVAKSRIDAVNDALIAEFEADPEFVEQVRQYPLNQTLFLGGEDQIRLLQEGRAMGQARGAFGHK